MNTPCTGQICSIPSWPSACAAASYYEILVFIRYLSCISRGMSSCMPPHGFTSSSKVVLLHQESRGDLSRGLIADPPGSGRVGKMPHQLRQAEPQAFDQ